MKYLAQPDFSDEPFAAELYTTLHTYSTVLSVRIWVTGIDDVQRAMRWVYGADKWTAEATARHVAGVWALLDFHQVL
jgi:hypothetical protein